MAKVMNYRLSDIWIIAVAFAIGYVMGKYGIHMGFNINL